MREMPPFSSPLLDVEECSGVSDFICVVRWGVVGWTQTYAYDNFFFVLISNNAVSPSKEYEESIFHIHTGVTTASQAGCVNQKRCGS